MHPMLQIRDRSAVIYYKADAASSNTEARRNAMLNARKTRYSGRMSKGSQKRLTKAITLMAMATKPTWIDNPITKRITYHHLGFITLTVSDPQNITAADAYKNLLAPFLQWLRRTKRTCYIWKVELQKRGQIHYHIVTPKWIHYKELRDEWNSLQRKAGYLDNYAKKHGHFKPNSTDITAIQKKKNTAAYLVKAICKEMAKSVDAVELEIREQVLQECREHKLYYGNAKDADTFWELVEEEVQDRMIRHGKVNGKTWDCSDTLAGASYFTIDFQEHHLQKFDELFAQDKLKILKEGDFWHLLVFTGSSPPDMLTGFENSEMDNYLQTLLN